MPASDALLNAAAALLLIALGWHMSGLARRLGRAGFSFLALGALVPLLDPLHFALTADDQIAFLTQNPLFAGPAPGVMGVLLAAAASLLLGAPLHRCARWAGCALAGLFGGVGLQALTPGGAPWLAPWSAHRFVWPVLPQDHLALIAVAGLALALLEVRPRLRTWVLAGAGTCLLALALIGVTGQLFLGMSSPLPAGAQRYLEPDPVWPGRWLEIAVDSGAYTAVTRGLGSAGDSPNLTPRWNDELQLLSLLEDPAVRRMYYEVFRHPVARVEVTGSQIELSVRELADALVDGRGATLLLQTDLHGRHRHYKVERLN